MKPGPIYHMARGAVDSIFPRDDKGDLCETLFSSSSAGPSGTLESSPAIHCRVIRKANSRPGGTLEMDCSSEGFKHPSGTQPFVGSYPAMNCRATFGRPSRDDGYRAHLFKLSQRSPKGIFGDLSMERALLAINVLNYCRAQHHLFFRDRKLAERMLRGG